MDTPIYNFLLDYSSSDTLRAHMPGHKGFSPIINALDELYRLDITEIHGADSLFEACGIIRESELNMARLYNSRDTVYSAGGSTLCIQAMLYLMKKERRKVFAVRNVHRAFLNACALLDVDVEWLYPTYNGGILSGTLAPDTLETALASCGQPACVYVTSPDYTGKIADIRSFAAICHRFGARLIVDNAHGAHLAFFPENSHPIALGTDLCCDSAHKMLPALTGAAMLHSGCELGAEELKEAMGVFGSTSPSYPILASLDLCTAYIANSIKSDIWENLCCLAELRDDFADRLVFADGDPFHVTIMAAASGLDGFQLAENLRKNGVECEYSDRDIVLLLMSPMNTPICYGALGKALDAAVGICEMVEIAQEGFTLPVPERAMSVRDAVLAPSETVPVKEAVGRVCSAVRVPCPPAVPIAASGEVISKECAEVFAKYGITEVSVVI